MTEQAAQNPSESDAEEAPVPQSTKDKFAAALARLDLRDARRGRARRGKPCAQGDGLDPGAGGQAQPLAPAQKR